MLLNINQTTEETIVNQENDSVKDMAKIFEELISQDKKYKYLKYKKNI